VPLRAFLSARRFIGQCRKPLIREASASGKDDPEEVLGELLNPALWRVLLLGPTAAATVSATEIEKITPLLAECLELILEPWLKRGRRELEPQLDYDRILEWVRLLGRAYE
jgi:hypothetical protein